MRRFAWILVLAAACAQQHPAQVAPAQHYSQNCTEVGSRTCTGLPLGALNPAVNQNNIGSTICVSGWTATVRPPASYTDQLKVKQLRIYHAEFAIPAPWNTDTNPADYEEDHFEPLELGGAPQDPNNLWPEPHSGPYSSHQKDLAENRLHKAVCAGKLSLSEAQSQIKDPANWHP